MGGGEGGRFVKFGFKNAIKHENREPLYIFWQPQVPP